ncbi:2-dehydro-3-deoxy-6-phosphogalactonate aldolase [Sphingomonas sp.]|uniref:2-dehydro-3-deoxy-6-phosphogalactonate aldolase n=1 Tax=Sphingomonas sp. TaxID=28214 RepID=UPI001EC8C0FE|nr:2-dehydro-3-deoxy-6-phosphogalactonate aldolase [Sphingomonas sp.]MBX3595836.1 2-dehydro-3-deoxy-6-phosphogalactonate aldolase [Sphingomonas sp.]
MNLAEALSECPVMAILRGVHPDEIETVADALVSSGIRAIEIPLNSPDALTSIDRLSRSGIGPAIVGAGTVLATRSVHECADAGARFIVSPNTDRAVITTAQSNGMATVPGFLTPTEAFAAIEAGATMLKLFPAEAVKPEYVDSLRAVLPPGMMIVVTGGISASSVSAWKGRHHIAFGVGGALYRPGWNAIRVADSATGIVEAVSGFVGG